MKKLIFLFYLSLLSCSKDPAFLEISENFLDFSTSFQKLEIVITNSGEDNLNWNAFADQNWIDIETKEGVLKESESLTIAVNVFRDLLDDGKFGGKITIQSNGGSEVVLVSIENPITVESQMKKLAKTWKVTLVTYLSAVAITNEWENFSLTINSDKTYVTENAPNPGPWPKSGSFKFANLGGINDINTIIRDDDLVILFSVSQPGEMSMLFYYYHNQHTGTGAEGRDGEYALIFRN